VSRRIWIGLCQVLVLVWLVPAVATAQTGTQPQPVDASSMPPPSRTWVVFGGAPTTLRGDCTFCEVEGREFRYNHTWSLAANVGIRLSSRMDAGAEVAWVPATTVAGDPFRTTFLLGIAQFRPWESQGFFLKGGAGMAFVRNWLFADRTLTQKALAVAIGGGWVFRRSERVGVQIYATQHAAALGDFELPEGTLENVMGNFWSIGAAVVFR